jgi:hypothetical protein
MPLLIICRRQLMATRPNFQRRMSTKKAFETVMFTLFESSTWFRLSRAIWRPQCRKRLDIDDNTIGTFPEAKMVMERHCDVTLPFALFCSSLIRCRYSWLPAVTWRLSCAVTRIPWPLLALRAMPIAPIGWTPKCTPHDRPGPKKSPADNRAGLTGFGRAKPRTGANLLRTADAVSHSTFLRQRVGTTTICDPEVEAHWGLRKMGRWQAPDIRRAVWRHRDALCPNPTSPLSLPLPIGHRRSFPPGFEGSWSWETMSLSPLPR